MPGLSLRPVTAALLLEIRRATSSPPSFESLQQDVVEVLSRDLARSNWMGGELLDSRVPGSLILRPVIADPTA
jgi:hypothetical protein